MPSRNRIDPCSGRAIILEFSLSTVIPPQILSFAKTSIATGLFFNVIAVSGKETKVHGKSDKLRDTLILTVFLTGVKILDEEIS